MKQPLLAGFAAVVLVSGAVYAQTTQPQARGRAAPPPEQANVSTGTNDVPQSSEGQAESPNSQTRVLRERHKNASSSAAAASKQTSGHRHAPPTPQEATVSSGTNDVPQASEQGYQSPNSLTGAVRGRNQNVTTNGQGQQTATHSAHRRTPPAPQQATVGAGTNEVPQEGSEQGYQSPNSEPVVLRGRNQNQNQR